MKIDIEMLEMMVATGATGEMILAAVRLQCDRHALFRAGRRPIECASKRKTRSGNTRTSVESGGSQVDNGGHQVDTHFETFWKAYPKRSGANPRAPAEKLFLGFVKAGTDPADIIAGTKACAAAESAKVGTQFIPQAVKWLRDRRWQDYTANIEPAADIDWDQVLTTFKKIGHWSKWAGPGLDSPACRAPPEMLAKYELRAIA